MDTVSIDISSDETVALANAVLFRLQYLSQQPVTPERNAEMHALADISRRIKAQMVANVQEVRREIRDGQN
jgi:hypothetical protein